jgi:hypothetical protein
LKKKGFLRLFWAEKMKKPKGRKLKKKSSKREKKKVIDA